MVKIKVDIENRKKLQKLHTATHLLNYVLRKYIGSHIWQNGSNLKPEIGSLDVTHYKNLNQNEIFEIEKKVNSMIFDNLKVTFKEMERNKAEKKYGFILYQGGAVPTKKIRIVNIGDVEFEACGGLHVENTSQIGLFKIINTNKIQDGVIRINYVVSEYAIKFIQENEKKLNEITNIFNVDKSTVVNTSLKFFNEWKQKSKQIKNLETELKNTYINNITKLKKNELKINYDFDMSFLIELFNEILKKQQNFKLITNKFIITTNNFKIDKYKKKINKDKFTIYVL